VALEIMTEAARKELQDLKNVRPLRPLIYGWLKSSMIICLLVKAGIYVDWSIKIWLKKRPFFSLWDVYVI